MQLPEHHSSIPGMCHKCFRWWAPELRHPTWQPWTCGPQLVQSCRMLAQSWVSLDACCIPQCVPFFKDEWPLPRLALFFTCCSQGIRTRLSGCDQCQWHALELNWLQFAEIKRVSMTSFLLSDPPRPANEEEATVGDVHATVAIHRAAAVSILCGAPTVRGTRGRAGKARKRNLIPPSCSALGDRARPVLCQKPTWSKL